ncbi:crotonobetainyl-CoA:carnitine CoA-transferase CaiB-like acyl-CoA transferase [Constrictibacter sp. MBR-5]|jgi:crotonobetainyl-CoA:carnitine CoA-transferase CaiB-like acyl-CoA transferase|uniref:CaiB/BaiF CoA transferase family protein n=1 Tax=Constrictibacter sp. MBR-5 TaxID=3156467 RepID=UPI003395096E
MSDPSMPLAGIRVLDLSRVLAGPICTMILADLGAEIIKVENPDGGDETRGMKPPEAGGEAHFYLGVNRTKKSVAIDISTPEGRELIHKLAAECDVLVENYRKGVMAKHGLDWEAMRDRHPHLVYCSISAYGRESPLADLPGFDPIIQAESGMMSLNGEPDGEPMRHALAIVDTMTGYYSTIGVMAAIMTQKETGRGQFVDVALFDVALNTLTNVGMYYFTSGKVPERRGNGHPTSVPNGLFQASDGPFYIALANQRLWKRFCEGVIDRPDMVDDPRYRTLSDRIARRDEITAFLRDLFATRTRAEWLARFNKAGVPGGAVRTVDQALESPEAAARDMVRTVAHPTAGSIRMVGSPLKLSATPVTEPVAPPLLGQHTDEVLAELLHLDADALATLRKAGAIG